MRVIYSPEEFSGKRSVLALGNFDGVHIGHAALIRRAVDIAGAQGAESVVCTFDRHPLAVLKPGSEPMALTTLEERLRRFEKLGADWAYVRPFTLALARTPAEEYLRELIRALRAVCVVVGENHRFGRDGGGDAALIRRVCVQMGVRAEIVPPVSVGGETVSSTRIRRLIAQGEREQAARLLG